MTWFFCNYPFHFLECRWSVLMKMVNKLFSDSSWRNLVASSLCSLSIDQRYCCVFQPIGLYMCVEEQVTRKQAEPTLGATKWGITQTYEFATGHIRISHPSFIGSMPNKIKVLFHLRRSTLQSHKNKIHPTFPTPFAIKV